MSSQAPSQPSSVSVSDLDGWSIYTPVTTSENVPADFVEGHDLRSSIPSHDSTFIIRATLSENVITLLDGQVILAPVGTRGSIYWTCVETEGWFGIRNCSSNKFLCHGWDGRLKCSAEQNDGWRHFTVTPMPEGGYIMQMLDWWTLRPIVINPEGGLQKLGRTGNKLSEGVAWEFIKVERDTDRVS